MMQSPEGFSSQPIESPPKPEIDQTAKLAYLAGYFDAHGKIQINPNMRGGVRDLGLVVSINTHNPDFLRAIENQYMPTNDEERQRSAHTKNSLSLKSQRAKEFLIKLLPYLRAKQKLASHAIDFQNVQTELSARQDYSRRSEEQERIYGLFKEEFEKQRRRGKAVA